MDSLPLVSICCITYNHAPFIRKSLDGFLMQKTSFPIEILIHDDASTDGTDSIIREYAKKYPDIIFPLYETENQFSSKKCSSIDIKYNYSRARGKYIAYCEGDDYWIDPLKLQKQVDFMESHADYSVCFHRCVYYNDCSGEMQDDACETVLAGHSGIDITLDSYFCKWVTQPLTMVFRLADYNFDLLSQYEYFRDYHEIYHLLKKGKGFLFGFLGGVHVKHGGGITANDEKTNRSVALSIARELYNNNRDLYTKKNYERVLQWNISSPLYSVKERFNMVLKLFSLNKRIIALINNTRHLIR